ASPGKRFLARRDRRLRALQTPTRPHRRPRSPSRSRVPSSWTVSLRCRDEPLQAPLRAEDLLPAAEREPRRRLFQAELHPAHGIDLASACPGFRAAHDLEELDLVGDALQ